MTISEFVNKYNGQYVRGGQCGELVRQYWIDVDKTNPPSYINSRDYWFNPVPGYDKVQNPTQGDIAIYDGHTGYPEGHSAIYVDNRVFEQNADPDGSPAHLFPRSTNRLLGYLHKQGSMEEEMPNDGDAVNFIRADRGDKTYNPSQGEINEAKKLSYKDWCYKLYPLNDGDAINFANARGGSPADYKGESFKHWAYAFSPKQGSTPKVTVDNVEYIPKG